MIFAAIVIVAVVLMAVWILRPAYKRWRDYLKDAPELQDAPFNTKVLVLFKGLRTRMLARLMDGLGVALPAINAIGEFIGAGGIDLSAILPAIPLGNGAELTAGQYAPLIFLLFGRLTNYLRSISTTEMNTIDPSLAVEVAGESNNVKGSTPSPSLAAIVDPRAGPVVAPRKPRAAPKRKIKKRAA